MRLATRFGAVILGVFSGAFVLGGCRGPQGPQGIMGPSGVDNPVYFFEQTFDGVGYNPNSQYTVYDPGSVSYAFGTTDATFFSAPDSLGLVWNAAAANDSGLYTSSGQIPSESGYDYYYDVEVYLAGMTTPGQEVELVLTLGGNTIATLGFTITSSTSANVYTYNNGNMVSLGAGVDTGFWQHAVLGWNHTTGLVTLSLAGQTLAQNISGVRSIPGTPGTAAGVIFPQGVAANNYVDLDNFCVYHY